MQIWKYPLEVTDVQDLLMPEGSEILSVQVQLATACIWAMGDEHNLRVPRRIRIYGTGHPMQGPFGRFIGTFQIHHADSHLVFHVFEIPVEGSHAPNVL